MRQRFANALEQYQHLVRIVNCEIDDMVNDVRTQQLGIPEFPGSTRIPDGTAILTSTNLHTAVRQPDAVLPPNPPTPAPSIEESGDRDEEPPSPDISVPPNPTFVGPPRGVPRAVTVEEIPDEGDGPPDYWHTSPVRELDCTTPLGQRDYMNAASQKGHTPRQKAGESRERPSAYLESRCSKCFGPNAWQHTRPGM